MENGLIFLSRARVAGRALCRITTKMCQYSYCHVFGVIRRILLFLQFLLVDRCSTCTVPRASDQRTGCPYDTIATRVYGALTTKILVFSHEKWLNLSTSRKRCGKISLQHNNKKVSVFLLSRIWCHSVDSALSTVLAD